MLFLTKEKSKVLEIFSNRHFVYLLSKRKGLTDFLSIIVQFLLNHRDEVDKNDINEINDFLFQKDFTEFCPCLLCDLYTKDIDMIYIPSGKKKLVKFEIRQIEECVKIYLIIEIDDGVVCEQNIEILDKIV
jgi:hypothetical protein